MPLGEVGWRYGAGLTYSAGADLDYGRSRTNCAGSRCGWGLFVHFFSRLPFLSSFFLSLGDGTI